MISMFRTNGFPNCDTSVSMIASHLGGLPNIRRKDIGYPLNKGIVIYALKPKHIHPEKDDYTNPCGNQ
jgi:hypothetical protein